VRTKTRSPVAGRRRARGGRRRRERRRLGFRVSAPRGAGQHKYSYCLISHVAFTAVYIMNLENKIH
jgi:hypothetical protein